MLGRPVCHAWQCAASACQMSRRTTPPRCPSCHIKQPTPTCGKGSDRGGAVPAAVARILTRHYRTFYRWRNWSSTTTSPTSGWSWWAHTASAAKALVLADQRKFLPLVVAEGAGGQLAGGAVPPWFGPELRGGGGRAAPRRLPPAPRPFDRRTPRQALAGARWLSWLGHTPLPAARWAIGPV